TSTSTSLLGFIDSISKENQELTKNEKDIELLDPMEDDSSNSYKEILLESKSEELFELDAKETNSETDSTENEHE
ncbi:12611_t:CDS:2, partial [Cetraspora pellucida]